MAELCERITRINKFLQYNYTGNQLNQYKKMYVATAEVHVGWVGSYFKDITEYIMQITCSANVLRTNHGRQGLCWLQEHVNRTFVT